MKVYVLVADVVTDVDGDIIDHGGEVIGVYSSMARAEEAAIAAETCMRKWYNYTISKVEFDYMIVRS